MMRSSPLKRIGIIAAAAAVLGCRPNLDPIAPKFVVEPVSLCAGACQDSVEITYLGVSGFLIRHGRDAILTAPSFTHPRLLTTFFPFISVRSDTQLVRWMMARERLDGVSAMLVGHAHYDHLLDAPFVASMLGADAKIYGGPTMKNILWGASELRPRLVALGGSAVGDRLRPGEWFPSAAAPIRFMALKSNHPPNIYLLGAFPYTYARGSVKNPRSSLPRTPRGWKLGETYAYLIDIMGPEGQPIFRIFYQDAAGEPEHSLIPPLLPNDQRRVDVAIICAGNAEYATGYPGLMLRAMDPKHVIVSHWENFFGAPVPTYRAIALSNTGRLGAQLRAEQADAWVTPQPRARVVYHF
jgi:hypothetical protein